MARKKNRSNSETSGWQKLERTPDSEMEAAVAEEKKVELDASITPKPDGREDAEEKQEPSRQKEGSEKPAQEVKAGESVQEGANQEEASKEPAQEETSEAPVIEDIKSWTPKASEIPPEDRVPKAEEVSPASEGPAKSAEDLPDEPPPVETIQSWTPKASEIPPEDRVPKPGEQVKPVEPAASTEQAQSSTKSNGTKKATAQKNKASRPGTSKQASSASEKAAANQGGVAVMDRRHYARGGKRRYSAAAPIGGIFVFLALVGLVTVVLFSVRATESLIDNSGEKARFEAIIQPVLMFDPVPFDDPNEMEELSLLRSSIWAAIIQNSGKYTFSDGNMVTVPQSDVDVACANLFGPSVKLNHHGFEDYFSIYAYNDETKSYYVPEDASILYTAKVEEITKKGDVLSLRVGYLAPDNQWMMNLNGEKQEPVPSKYMIYELKKVEDHYQLISIKDPPEGAIPGVPQIRSEDQSNQILPDTVQPQDPDQPALPLSPAEQAQQEEGLPQTSQEEDGEEGTEPPEENGGEDQTDPDETQPDPDQEPENAPASETDNEPETV